MILGTSLANFLCIYLKQSVFFERLASVISVALSHIMKPQTTRIPCDVVFDF